MFKHSFYLIALILTLASCSNNNKHYFTDQANNFKIKFPGEPISSNQTITFPFGAFAGKKFVAETTSGLNSSYSVLCVELPKTIVTSDSINLLSQLFGLSQLDYARQIGEQGLLNTWIKNVNKYPGREFVWNDPKSNTGYTRRVFLVKNMLYLLEVSYPSNNQHNFEILSFLNSFRLLNAAVNPNPEPTPIVPKKKFDIAFPGKSITRRQIIQGSKGPEYLVNESFEAPAPSKVDEFGNTAYCVNYIDFRREPMIQMSAEVKKNFLYENSLKNPVIQNGGKVLSAVEATIDGYPCIEMRALILEGQIEFWSKTFFCDNYLYQVIVLSLPEKGNNQASKEFMESFHYHK